MVLVNEFLEQVKKNPEQIAVVSEDKRITYKEINEFSDFIASHILMSKPEKGHIALIFNQCAEMITAVLSVLKAGMTYVPLSDYYPDLRIKHILEDAQAEVIVTNTLNFERVNNIVKAMDRNRRIINIDEIKLIKGDGTQDSVPSLKDNYEKRGTSNEKAYILYTSGSTGTPKGVMQTQHNILHFAKQYASRMQIGAGTRMTLLSSFCHDAAVIDIFSGLLHGATLYPRDLRMETAFEQLSDWLIKEKINIWHSVPTLFRHFTTALSGKEIYGDLKYIVLGGENVLQQDIDRYKKFFSDSVLVNLYGQSESSFNSSQFISAKDENVRIHIGDRIDNVLIFVVDENNEEVMPLSTGEIVIASPHAALGYWNKEQETSMVFEDDTEFGSLYWTGDLGRLETDGTITWLGRKDNQLKIRGYRVEPGDIESCISELEGIKNAAVIAKTKADGEYELVAFYTAVEPVDKNEIAVHMRDRLPEYMMPNIFIELENIPLTASSKVDRKALQALEIETNRSNEYVAPRNEDEERLVSIWKDILGVDSIGVFDNFFELGGHSLRATILSGRIRKELDTTIGVRDIFECPNIAELAERIEKNKGDKYETLEPLEKKESYPVSSAQKRLYAMQMINEQSTAYNMPMLLELTGEVDKAKLEKAVCAVAQKHESLRTSFHTEGEEIIQKIFDEIELDMKYVDTKDNYELEEFKQSWIRPFELSKAPLMRVGLVKERERHLLFLDMHHIISDGTTMGILAEDFIRAYNGEELVSEDVQYKEFAQWEKLQKENDAWQKQKEYWEKEFEGEIPILELPLDGVRGKVEDSEGDIYSFEINKETVNGLKKAVGAIGGTLYMGLMAGYSILLSKYSGQQDIVIGGPIAGRLNSQLERTAGMFVNTIAVRTQPEGEKKLSGYLSEVKQKLLGAYENQEYPYEKLIEDLKIKRDLSRNPLFDVMLILQNMDAAEMKLPEIQITPQRMDNGKAKLDITLVMVDAGDRLLCDLEYRSKLYNRKTIERMMKHYVKILKEIGENSDKSIKEIELLEAGEKAVLLGLFNNTQAGYESEKTFAELFEDQVNKNPEGIAVVYGDEKYTYKELNDRANALAAALRLKGIVPDSIVGIMIPRSLEMIVGVLGIIKSGGAYLPIDPEYPLDRINYMLSDSQAKMLLTTEALAQDASFVSEVLRIERALAENVGSPNPEIINKPDDLIYVIYTSGSTGKPKGVMIEHKNVNNLVKGMSDRIDFSSDKAILTLTTISFDMSIPELLLPLIKGVRMIIGDEKAQKDISLLSDIIVKNNIDILQMTPSRLQMLLISGVDLSFLQGVKEIITGAEPVPFALLKELRSRTKAKIYNMYGPTETTVWSTAADLTESDKIHIGKPIANTRIYIVDKDNNLQPIGTPGEICIAGDGLTRGYINRIELTTERYVENPFEISQETGLKETMYRTGDLARWLPDGNIEFLGRIDHQVKIRGYRIELGEVENAIKAVEGVSEAVVLVKGSSENKYLCAYLVLNNTDFQSVKDVIKERLPHYMLPTSYVAVDKIPLTSNGKINRQALLNLQGNEETRKKIPPRNFHDNTIAQIWKDVLGLEEVYIYDDFFEMGGNSINIIQVANRIKEALEVDISYADLMVYKTVLELSEYIKDLDIYSSKQFKHAFKINKSTSKKNIFIIHGADGSIFYFRHLAKLLEDEYSVYGLQPRGLNGEEPFPDSYFEMIHDYVKEIRMIQSEGPYLVAGYCIGGYLSYDIVNIFELQGDKVTALIQLDEEAFITKHTHKSIFLYRSILNIIDTWRKITKKDKMFTLEKFRNLIPKAKPISRERQLEILKQRRSIQKYFGEELALGCYYANLGFIKSPTLVIKGEDNDHPLFREDLWRKMVRGELEYYVVPGDHETVMFPPYVERFAEIIKEYLKDR